MSIRDVRPTDDFYRDVDQALTLAGGEMSRSDFGLFVLAGILGRFATDWDQLPMPIPGRPEYRILIGYATHLGAYAVEAQMAWDGVIELTSLIVDPLDVADGADRPGAVKVRAGMSSSVAMRSRLRQRR